MSYLEIGLIVALVVVVLICVVFMWIARKIWHNENDKASEWQERYQESDIQHNVCQIALGENCSERMKVERENIELSLELKEATDQLKQIKDLREAGKELRITLAFLDDEKKHVGESFSADRVEFVDGDEGVVAFFLGDDEDPVCCIERENYILHKKDLVDIEKPKDEK